jgi:hypothetical protein
MGWIECVGQGGGSGEAKVIRNIYAPTAQASSETYTIAESGLYVIVAGYSARGSATITLPSGRTAIVSGDLIIDSPSFPRGLKYAVAELSANDVVTIGSTADNWTGHGRFICKVEGFDITSGTAVAEVIQKDAIASYTIPDNTPYFLIGFGCGRDGNSYCHGDTSISDTSITTTGGANCVARFSYCSGIQGVVYDTYAYNGGVSVIVALRASA